ncbi:MAG: DUF808 domain-containing protein [Gammaproteobacteria bacterium]
MAGASLLTLLDDIATMLDDVSLLTKVAAKKTSGVLADDLALNAEQVTGVRADRELRVVWAVAKGSLLNKAILVPAALAISAFIPWLITPLLMAGGLFLCFEGVEKIAHRFLHSAEEKETHRAEITRAVADPSVDLVAMEEKKIKGAIRTDFILSAEIIVIALGVVADSALSTQLAVLVVIALLITIGVYGIVAGIVKLDDVGLHLSRRPEDGFLKSLGFGILTVAPYLMKTLSVAGTAAMFLVGGGILAHGFHGIESWIHHLTQDLGTLAQTLSTALLNGGLGIIAGSIAVALVTLGKRLFGGGGPAPSH